MRQIISRSLAGLVPILFFCSGCGSPLTQANYDQITPGMSKEQVEKVLGSPTKVEEKMALVFSGQSKWEPRITYRYEDGQKFATITFKDDKVDSKDSNLSQKP
jgi:hypothetical protein